MCTNAAGAGMRKSSLGLLKGAKNYFTLPSHWGGDLQGKDCSQQSFCISTLPGGQTSEGTTPGTEKVELRQEQQPRTMQATGRDAGS